MSHFSHQRSLATELITFYLENKTQALVVINGLIVFDTADVRSHSHNKHTDRQLVDSVWPRSAVRAVDVFPRLSPAAAVSVHFPIHTVFSHWQYKQMTHKCRSQIISFHRLFRITGRLRIKRFSIFYRATLWISAVFAVGRCPSVRLCHDGAL